MCPPLQLSLPPPVSLAQISGVLQDFGGLDQKCRSPQKAEHYVVKVDQAAQVRIDSFIQEAQSNTYTLYILVHDHAHWDIRRYCLNSVPNCDSSAVGSVLTQSALSQCVLQQLRPRPRSGGPAVELPAGHRCSEHPDPPRHLLPLRSSDTAHSNQPLQRDPLALRLQQCKTRVSKGPDRLALMQLM